VINIERDVAMGGPIQQKAAMIIHGWLMGRFARTTPLSFACSVTFEQNYGGVEGDSASLAELLAILSDLAGAPLRQDLAITGSVNQRGDAQPVGGVRHKVEGFFRACLARGGLTGSQGVVVPSTNERNLILADDVVEAVRAGRFHVWSVAHIDEAVTLFTGTQAGVADGSGRYPADSVYGRVAATLEAFDARLARDSRG
jgi:predicted ATP-dependent protease